MAAPVITSPADDPHSVTGIEPGTIPVINIEYTGDNVTDILVTGPDAALFVGTAGATPVAIEFLDPAVAGSYDATFELIGDGSDSVRLLVTVEAAVTPPTITSDGGGSTASVNVAEGTTAVTTVTATGDAPITFSITGGADQAKFSIVEATGVLTFASAPDYENPTDAGTNNTYVVDVTATNAGGTDVQTITATVTNDPSDDTPENPLQNPRTNPLQNPVQNPR